MEQENSQTFKVQDNSNIEGSTLEAARTHYAEGRYAEALKLLAGVTHTVANAEVYIEIGNCHYMMKNYPLALESWEKAISLDPKSPKAYANIGNLYYKNREVDKAISHWLVALVSRPEDSHTCLNLAVAFNEKNMRFESIKYFERYVKYCEDKSSDTYKQVKANLQHCFDVASQYLTFGVQCQSENDDKKAAACYFKSLANYPNLSKTNLNLGSIFFADKNLDLAIKYWKASMFINPNYDKIYSNLAISYDLKQEFDYAYCYYDRYMNYIINDKEEYAKVNRRLLKIKPLLKEHPELVSKHLDLANKHLAKSEFNEAIDEFKNYSILNPEEKQQYKDMIEKLEAYLNPELELIKNCFDFGNRLMSEGKYTEAKPYFYRIMRLSSPEYLEFTKAKGKYAQCERAEYE